MYLLQRGVVKFEWIYIYSTPRTVPGTDQDLYKSLLLLLLLLQLLSIQPQLRPHPLPPGICLPPVCSQHQPAPKRSSNTGIWPCPSSAKTLRSSLVPLVSMPSSWAGHLRLTMAIPSPFSNLISCGYSSCYSYMDGPALSSLLLKPLPMLYGLPVCPYSSLGLILKT